MKLKIYISHYLITNIMLYSELIVREGFVYTIS